MQKYSFIIKKYTFSLLLIAYLVIFSQTFSVFSQSTENDLKSSSLIDWTKGEFYSTATIDLQANSIPFPSGKDTAMRRLSIELPFLIKEKLFSIPVDSSMQLGDVILQRTITLEQLTSLIDNGEKTAGVFSRNLKELEINHSIKLLEITSMMIKHTKSYSPTKPIDRVSSREYSGIIIDARGLLPVQGEFISEQAVPCIFPKIWDDTMELLYEKNMLDVDIVKTQRIVTYSYSDDESLYENRVGKDPLRISARKIFGINRTDPVISRNDALKILSIPGNIELLKQGKVVILMDKDQLIHNVEAIQKDPLYYTTYNEAENIYELEQPEETSLDSTPKGIRISIQKLKFIADSSKLLPEETERLDSIAKILKVATENNEYTILVEGHTASVGKPDGEQVLSVERAKAIIDAMIERGIDATLFSYQGYGGTMPIADNGTTEGRAQNRRVEITVVPKTKYIRRDR